MKTSDAYIKLVEWSEEDNAYIGQCPGIIGPCCHGSDEAAVYAELCVIVDEWLAHLMESGQPLPPATSGPHVVEKLLSDAG